MARGTIRDLAAARTQQWSFAVRTSRPAESEEGDAWIRSDIHPDEGQIGALEVDTGGGYQTVPIYDPARVSFGADVEPVRGVRVNETVGVIPVATPADASGPPLRVAHGGTYQTHTGTEISAIPDSVVDHFEEVLYEDQGNTLSDYYSGDLTNFTRQQDTVKTGTYALESTADGSIGSTTGLPNYPAEGDTFEWHTYIVGDDDAAVGWGTNGVVINGDGYEFDIDTGNELTLRRFDSGSITELAYSSPTIPSGEWLRAEIDWASDGTMTCSLYDSTDSLIDTISATDNTYENNTGISFRNGGAGSNSVYWDEYFLL